MPKAKRKLLPKDFDVLLEGGDLTALKAVFDVCDLEARGGYSKQTALSFLNCPDDLARWLVDQGADTESRDSYQRTALHARAASRRGRIDILLELGADIHAVDYQGDTPLHAAAQFANLDAVCLLIGRGARTDALNVAKLTPLEAALLRCSNIDIVPMADIASVLLTAAPQSPKGLGGLLKAVFHPRESRAAVTPRTQDLVRKIGETFEFHRQGFNPDSVEITSAALDRLYQLFDVTPVPRRILHDGRTPIVARSSDWKDQHEELWAILVPSSGAASTVQGEVIRITGRISNEIDGNGGVNWDTEYGKMAKALLAHLASGASLPPHDLDRARRIVAEVRTRDGAAADLCQLAVQWVALNPAPAPLDPPDYRR